MTREERRKATFRKASRRYRQKHERTPEQKAAANARWMRWYNSQPHPVNTGRCPVCGVSLEGRRPNTKFCTQAHRDLYNHAGARKANMQQSIATESEQIADEQLALPGIGVEPKVVIISARQARIAEGLPVDDPQPTPHVCHFYAPSYRCVCGAQGERRPVASWARSVFVPSE